MEIIKFDENDAGCLIDSHVGQYGIATMVHIANQHGYFDADVITAAMCKLVEMQPRNYEAEITEDQENLLLDTADEVEMWMNINLAPDGYAFGWHDGDFFLQSMEWWSDQLDSYESLEELGPFGIDLTVMDYIPETDGFNSGDPFDKEYDLP